MGVNGRASRQKSSCSKWMLFTSVPLPSPLQIIHLILSQFQYSTEPLVINDLPLVDAFQFVEDLIIE